MTRKHRRAAATEPRSAVTLDLPEVLQDAFTEGNCLLYAGSGLSTLAGLPNWTTIIERLIAIGVRRRHLRTRTAGALRRAMKARVDAPYPAAVT